MRAKRTKTVSTPLQPADDIEVLEILRDTTGKGKAGATIRVFRGEFSPAIPDRPCTVYLTEWGKDWALVDVSHAEK